MADSDDVFELLEAVSSEHLHHDVDLDELWSSPLMNHRSPFEDYQDLYAGYKREIPVFQFPETPAPATVPTPVSKPAFRPASRGGSVSSVPSVRKESVSSVKSNSSTVRSTAARTVRRE